MDNKRLMTFWLDKIKHQRFKTKAASEKVSITQILSKAVDAYIGKEVEIIAGDVGRLEAGYEVTKRDKTNGDITGATLKEISFIPPKRKIELELMESGKIRDGSKQKKIEELREKIGGVSPDYSAENIQDIPKEDFPEEKEISYTPDKQ